MEEARKAVGQLYTQQRPGQNPDCKAVYKSGATIFPPVTRGFLGHGFYNSYRIARTGKIH